MSARPRNADKMPPVKTPMAHGSGLSIGQVALQSGVSARMIRHYELQGLLPAAQRTEAGYRVYEAADIHRLSFIKRARDLGFEMDEISQLLSLWKDQKRSNAQVREIATQHMQALQQRIEQLQSMHETLSHLVDCCAHQARPECPILDDLSGRAQHPIRPKS